MKYIVGGQLPGATAAVFAIDNAGSVDALGYNAAGQANGAWVTTANSTVSIGK